MRIRIRMATAKNDITGDSIRTKTSRAYRQNYDAIFGKKDKVKPTQDKPTKKEDNVTK
jgi:hypothetical protein